VKVLLAHPDIDVNVKDIDGYTPFAYACGGDNVPVVQMLLKDPRVDVTLNDTNGHTPLWSASSSGLHEVIEWLIASGRDLGDIENMTRRYSGREYTALEMARENVKPQVVRLLERFIAHPAQTRHEVRVKLGLLDALAAEIFALTVFFATIFFNSRQRLLAPT